MSSTTDCTNQVIQHAYGGASSVLCQSSDLPFTGFDLTLLIGGGVTLIVIGFILRLNIQRR